jgi:hypothetical protein
VQAWRGLPEREPAVRFGSAAYGLWGTWLRRGERHDRNEPSPHRQHVRLLRSLAAQRRACAAWLHNEHLEATPLGRILAAWAGQSVDWLVARIEADRPPAEAADQLPELEALDAACVDALAKAGGGRP